MLPPTCLHAWNPDTDPDLHELYSAREDPHAAEAQMDEPFTEPAESCQELTPAQIHEATNMKTLIYKGAEKTVTVRALLDCATAPVPDAIICPSADPGRYNDDVSIVVAGNTIPIHTVVIELTSIEDRRTIRRSELAVALHARQLTNCHPALTSKRTRVAAKRFLLKQDGTAVRDTKTGQTYDEYSPSVRFILTYMVRENIIGAGRARSNRDIVKGMNELRRLAGQPVVTPESIKKYFRKSGTRQAPKPLPFRDDLLKTSRRTRECYLVDNIEVVDAFPPHA